jgi:hypothetical protein
VAYPEIIRIFEGEKWYVFQEKTGNKTRN